MFLLRLAHFQWSIHRVNSTYVTRCGPVSCSTLDKNSLRWETAWCNTQYALHVGVVTGLKPEGQVFKKCRHDITFYLQTSISRKRMWNFSFCACNAWVMSMKWIKCHVRAVWYDKTCECVSSAVVTLNVSYVFSLFTWMVWYRSVFSVYFNRSYNLSESENCEFSAMNWMNENDACWILRFHFLHQNISLYRTIVSVKWHFWNEKMISPNSFCVRKYVLRFIMLTNFPGFCTCKPIFHLKANKKPYSN